MQKLILSMALVLVAAGCGGSSKEAKKETADSNFEYRPYLQPRAKNLTPTSSVSENVLLKGATVMTATGEKIENGFVWLKDGKIEAVSKEAIDATDAEVIDVTGKFITPGIIDTHSHMGVYSAPGVSAHSDGNEAVSNATPHVDALWSIWPQDPQFQKALKGGITVAQVLPGSGNLIGGNGVVIEMKPAISARAMLMEEAPKTIKMACGENPKRVYGKKGGPSTRMGNYAGFRARFQKAKEYKASLDKHQKAYQKWEKEGSDPESKPAEPKRDFGMEALAAVLSGDTLVHIHCYRADEMIQLLQLSDEFGFKVRSFHHAVEAYKIRDILAKWEVGVSTWADWWGFKIEAHDATLYGAALLSEAGVPTIIHSDSGIGIQRLNQEAAKVFYAAKAEGVKVTENDALRWITYYPAWALGIENVTGTLEAGKRADVVVWSEHPLSIYAKAEMVFVKGSREYDSAKPGGKWSDFETGQNPMMEGGR